MPKVKVNGIHLYYEEYESGHLILLHGLGGDHQMFGLEIEQLELLPSIPEAMASRKKFVDIRWKIMYRM
ncbi:alpha/beta fold hydrolase [Fictibacillus sp. NRS-1165]|uniref:alpha/beta fold hydrolase n=1 Tax=Fictibacillus sp. NRS-1165 TaxID=3144463 RepID=UPI003D2583C2